MPEDVGGTPFPDGGEPDDDRDHGVSDEEFASVVFDEAFVKAATVHEPTAVERLLAAAEARAEASEAEARRARARRERYEEKYSPEGTDLGHDRDEDELDDTYVLSDYHGPFGSYGNKVRWHRPVAWLLALVMGIGMVALAFAAVYRSASSGTRDRVPPPASTGLEQGATSPPPSADDHSRPAVSAIPRSP
ncbi:SCO2584 family spore wall biosynthesis protein [Streptomyces sp. NPDC002676]